MNININLIPPPLTCRYIQRFTLYRLLIILFFFATVFTSNTFAHTQEWLMQITSVTPVSAHIFLYKNGEIIREGDSIAGLPWAFNPSEINWSGNFGSDVQPYIGANKTNGSPITWDIIDPGTYIVRIKINGATDVYFSLFIPNAPGGANDFNIAVDLVTNSLSFIINDRGAVLGSNVALNWVEHNVTLKNSFGGGDVIVDGDTVFNIGVSGKTYTWVSNTFPHTLEAIDQIIADGSGNFMRRFDKWSGLNTSVQSKL